MTAAFASQVITLPSNDNNKHSTIAVDPVTIVIKECLLISSSMRKVSKYSQSGVAAILGGGAGDLFQDDEDLHKYGISSGTNGNTASFKNDPLLSGFIQLRLLLNNEKSLHEIDSLTLLQPFLLVIKSSSTSGNITSLALNSLSKFLTYGIVSLASKNLEFTLTHIINSLTHCRFEAFEPSSDDAVLLKVLKLLETIVNSPLGGLLSDEAIYEVVQTSLSLACNKRRTEVLRSAAELSMFSVTVQIFKKLDEIEPEHLHHVVEETQDYSKDQLVGTIGTNDDPSLTKKSFEVANDANHPFGLHAIKQFLGILISMIAPENQFKHTESTKVFALALINTAIEMMANRFARFPTLMNLIADPVFKHTLQIIQTANSSSVVQAALQLFTTLTLTLGDKLKPQIERTLISIFAAVLPPKDVKDVSSGKSGKSTPVEQNQRSAAVKELLIEEISILWTRSPSFFTSLFINYDCNFHRHDLSIEFLNFLSQIALPDSASFITDSVPPICLEGVLSFVNNLSDLIKTNSIYDENGVSNELILKKQQKKEFITATEIFNKKPKEGLKLLQDKGFIKSTDDNKEVAAFFYEKSSRLNKKVLGEFLTKSSNKDLLTEFLNFFDFENMRVDEALRILLKAFRLPGESQQIERIVETFASRYVACQHYEHKDISSSIPPDPKLSEDSKTEAPVEITTEEIFEPVEPDPDAVFVLSYSIIMLNTDFHNPNVKAHMTMEDYKKNLRGVYGGRDFPSWYLGKIYESLQDKEIVMPEEHHGSSQWFDDSWNNLIASNSSVVDETHAVEEFDGQALLQFNKIIFQSVFESVSNTIFHIFNFAADDQVITRMMTTVDKLSQISSFFGLVSFSDKIVSNLTKLTSLSEKKTTARDDGTPAMKTTSIKVQDSGTITVSETSVQFGNDFKAQLSAVILFRIIKRDTPILSKSWPDVIKVLLTLYETGLIEPDIFAEFQAKSKLSKLPKVKAGLTLTRSTVTKGLFSTFASYLKGDEEPTDEEVEATLSAVDCIKSCTINLFFKKIEESKSTDFLASWISASPSEEEAEDDRYYSNDLLFLSEASIALIVNLEDPQFRTEYANKALHKIEIALQKDKKLKRYAILRLLTYELILSPFSVDFSKELVPKILGKLITYEKSVLEQKSGQLIDPLCSLSLGQTELSALVINDESYWKILRTIASISNYTNDIFEFVSKFIKTEAMITQINPTNFMWLLGLLDEISAVGAIGGQWEQEYDLLVKTGHKVDKENPYQEIVQLSLKSISLTSGLLNFKRSLSKEGVLALIQALAHQCLNPCFQIRSYALTTLEETIFKINFEESATTDEIFELGLFPLMNEDISKLDILSMISKVYIHFLKIDKTNNQIYLKILDVFNHYLDDPEIEDALQKLIQSKKEFDKDYNHFGTESVNKIENEVKEKESESKEEITPDDNIIKKIPDERTIDIDASQVD